MANVQKSPDVINQIQKQSNAFGLSAAQLSLEQSLASLSAASNLRSSSNIPILNSITTANLPAVSSSSGESINRSATLGNVPGNSNIFSNNNGNLFSNSATIPTFNNTLDRNAMSIGVPGNNGISDDILLKLRFTEEQLQQERRARSWVEAELQAGKTLLASLSARVDKLQEASGADSQTVRELNKMIHEADQRSRDNQQQLANRLDRDGLKLHQLVADLMARQQSDEKLRQDQEERFRSTAEAINHMRYQLEAYTLKTNQVGTEFYAKAKDWEIESYQRHDAIRVIREHDQALQSLQGAVDSSADALARRMDLSTSDIRQRLDAEARVRTQFEENVRSLYSDLRKALQTQEREAIDRIEAVRRQAIETIDRDRQERERAVNSCMEQVKSVEKSSKDAQIKFLEKVTQQLNVVDGILGEERQARKVLETQIQTAVEEGFKIVQQMVAKKGDEAQQQQNDLKSVIAQAIKSLQDSIVLVEKTSEQKLLAIEDVLRAEIKSRMETDALVNNTAQDLNLRLDITEKRVLNRLEDAIDAVKMEQTLLADQLQKITIQAAESKERTYDDLEQQINTVTNKLKESDSLVKDRLKDLASAFSSIETEMTHQIEETKDKLIQELDTVKSSIQQTDTRFKEIENMCDEVKTYVEDKLNLKTVQIDSTMEAFKAELSSLARKNEVDSLQELLESETDRISLSIENIQGNIAALKDGRDNFVSKANLSESEAQLKSFINNVQSKAVHVEENLISITETLATRASRKDLADAEERAKIHINKLQDKQSEIRDTIVVIKNNIADRVTKETLNEVEEHLSNRIVDCRNLIEGIDTNIALIREAAASTVSPGDLETIRVSVDDKITQVADKADKISDMVMETRERLKNALQADINIIATECGERVDLCLSRLEGNESKLEAVRNDFTVHELAVKTKFDEIVGMSLRKEEQTKDIVDSVRILLGDQCRELARRVDDIGPQISSLETAVENNKNSIEEAVRSEAQSFEKAIVDIQKRISSKVSADEFENSTAETRTILERHNAKFDIFELSFDQIRQRIGDQEQLIKDKWKDSLNSSDRTARELERHLKAAKDSIRDQMNELDSRLSDVPKSIQNCSYEIKKIRADLNGPLAMQLMNVEKETFRLKTDIQKYSTNNDIENIVTNIANTMDRKIEQARSNLDELQASFEAHCRHHNSNTFHERNATGDLTRSQGYVSTPKLVPGSFFKPAHLSFGDKSVDNTIAANANNEIPATSNERVSPVHYTDEQPNTDAGERSTSRQSEGRQSPQRLPVQYSQSRMEF